MEPMRQYEIAQIRLEVERLRLNGWDFVLSVPFDSLLRSYNGTGPEDLPDALHEKLDKVAKPFLPAVMVHDLDFTWSDGTVKAFNAANDRLLENCVRCSIDAHPWYSWRRYALFLKAIAIYRACCRFGWTAWLSAYRKNQKEQEKLK